MEEFELYTRILAPRFQAESQNYLIEKKCAKPQKASVIDTAVDHYVIYRFDMDTENFLPCFNNTHASKGKTVEYPTPKGLLSFCDYIILAVIDNKRKDSTYPFRELAGVGVVFKVIQALGIKLGLKEEEYLKYLDIVCIGTI